MINESLKKEIRKTLFEMLSTNYQKKWRDTLNEAVIEVLKSDTQHNIDEFLLYFQSTLDLIYKQAASGDSMMTNEVLEFLRTIRKVFKALLIKKTNSGIANGKVFEVISTSSSILRNFVGIWQFFNENLRKIIDNSAPVNDENVLMTFVKFSRLIDAILLLLIDSAKPEQVELE